MLGKPPHRHQRDRDGDTANTNRDVPTGWSGGVAKALRKVAETFAELSDGKTVSHVLGLLAHLLDPARAVVPKTIV